MIGGEEVVLWTWLDISDRKRAEQALQEANMTLEKKVQQRTAQLRKLAGELTLAEQRERMRLACIIHDHLQQLLVAAKFRTSVLGRGGIDGLKEAARGIEDLLDESISASRSLTAELNPPILHEAGLGAGVQWLSRRMADKHGLCIQLEVEEIGPLPDDLKFMLFESIRELLFNIVEHAHTCSASLSLRRADASLQVTVSDQGTGFDSDRLAADSGMGFGLFGIRERIQLVGGTLEIDSSPGRGSRFIITVPITEAGGAEPQSMVMARTGRTGDPMRALSSSGRKIRVMLADDHAVVRQGIANMLGDEPDIEIVGAASDGQEAVSLAHQLLPDIILMDISMPKLNGVEATRIIHSEYREICVIGLSMFEEVERAQAMREAGAVHYVTKSGAAEALIAAIRKFGSRRREVVN